MPGALIAGDPLATAVIDADTGDSMSYDQLTERVGERTELLEKCEVALAFLFAQNDLETVVDYLALRQMGSPVLLMDGATPTDRLMELTARYEPDVLLRRSREVDGYVDSPRLAGASLRSERAEPRSIEEPVSVLLSTSGSTGNPKFVQLTDENLNVNAVDIISSLSVRVEDRGLQPLPLFYSYGLSILNSHLAIGATTVLTNSSPLRPEFWDIVAGQSISSIPGVPYSYAIFKRAGLFEKDISALRYMTQAGGKLDRDSVLEVHAGLSALGKQFFVMYGQTEASPRMSVLPSEDLPDHAHTAGFALDHGTFEIADLDAEGSGEVQYAGPNVMIGYAKRRDDIGVRSLHGPLLTGDLGYLDEEGRLTITGRLKRIAKLFGNRISLRDIESHFSFLGPVAAVEGENVIRIFHEHDAEKLASEVKALEQILKVPPRTIQMVCVPELPRNANGKIDYKGLKQ